MQIGNIGINPAADLSKKEFIKALVGIPQANVEENWKRYSKLAKAYKKKQKSSSE